ncbi:hypothetical protein ACJX0J_022425 [Zea mays]
MSKQKSNIVKNIINYLNSLKPDFGIYIDSQAQEKNSEKMGATLGIGKSKCYNMQKVMNMTTQWACMAKFRGPWMARIPCTIWSTVEDEQSLIRQIVANID